ncbi:malonyl-[acyl-carrier protein] O-methyltransferase BioC [Halothiobacillus diazotrophicus]|uniref:Malonyl-[acyl-carrier protein] O-methyltransferase n=1 Tax=Halothiobacillus diazotrophicus TaxID=1860122 RepID=A0A191ZGT1_9GAMM|nr:malonyl-ACP O-methyltransferase BioC [Halothiobacillus diazotrophicus]ANJ67094.1 malonyl-[acyl-carrier protein] O-methyltransferase BioC [Halothiobacillus diazotrophicus]
MFDYAQVRARFNRAHRSYDQYAVVQQEAGRRLAARFDWLKLAPTRILDLGAGTGQMTRALQARYPKAAVFALDLAEEMLETLPKSGRWIKRKRAVCADMHHLPFATGSFDIVISNFAIQWSHDLGLLLAEIARVLAPGGVLSFTTLGPESLRECRRAWAAVDGGSHIHGFLDMHDVGDAMVRACLADPVLDQEQLILHYPDAMTLLRELRGVGVGNTLFDRSSGLTGRHKWQAFLAALEAEKTGAGIPLTYEVVYGLAWGSGISPMSEEPRKIP